MKIVIAGASGDVGQRALAEALGRGHDVTAVVRSQAQFGRLPDAVTRVAADLADRHKVASIADGQDLFISAVRPPAGREAELAALTRAILDGTAEAGVGVILVGGAARLRLPNSDETVLTAEDFLPKSVLAIAYACQAQYELCRADETADWTYVSPPAMLEPGQRTGGYRTGTDTLLIDQDGNSHISMEDFAVALLDEAGTRLYRRQAFTVGY